MRPTIHSVISPKDFKTFIRLPNRLYADDPSFVAPRELERRQFLSPEKNPVFQSLQAAYFLARDPAGRPVGRITAHIHSSYNEYWNDRVGFFGFFESIHDPEVARALLETAEAWLRERGMRCIRGPFNFTSNDECGLLVSGFDRPPALLMPYTKSYYPDLLGDLGYQPAKDLLAYEYESDGTVPTYLDRLADRLNARAQVTIRPLDMKDFEREVKRTFQVYNSSWQRNWGFVPISESEFRFTARKLKPIIDPSVALLAERPDGELVGFFLAVPDYNLLLRSLRGRLLPFGWLYLLRHKRHLTKARVMALGVLESYRKRGIETLLLHASFRYGLPAGYRSCEMSWVLEDNEPMKRAIERLGGTISKRYRIFEKGL